MKKMTRILFSLFIFTLLSSFLGFLFGDGRTASTKMGHKISGEIGKKLQTKYGVNFMGISEAGPDGKYITIGFELSFRKLLSKDEGRILLLNCAKDALEIFNSHPEFEQHMANVPFTNDNIIINIFVYPPEVDRVYHPDIAVLSFYDGVLRYYTNSPTHVPTLKQMYYTEERETFEEALKIIEAQQGRAGLGRP